MLQRAVILSRYVVFVAVVAALAGSIALILYEAAVVAEVIFSAIRQGGFQLQSGKALAVGLIEAIDVFLIAIVALVIGLGLLQTINVSSNARGAGTHTPLAVRRSIKAHSGKDRTDASAGPAAPYIRRK